MNVGELRLLLEGVGDSVQILIPVDQQFNGYFYSPAVTDSGLTYMGSEQKATNENMQAAAILHSTDVTNTALLLVPFGFFEEKEQKVELN